MQFWRYLGEFAMFRWLFGLFTHKHTTRNDRPADYYNIDDIEDDLDCHHNSTNRHSGFNNYASDYDRDDYVHDDYDREDYLHDSYDHDDYANDYADDDYDDDDDDY